MFLIRAYALRTEWNSDWREGRTGLQRLASYITVSHRIEHMMYLELCSVR